MNTEIISKIKEINKEILKYKWESQRLEYEMNHVETTASKEAYNYFVVECGCSESSIGYPRYIKNKEINKHERLKIAQALQILKLQLKAVQRQLI